VPIGSRSPRRSANLARFVRPWFGGPGSVALVRSPRRSAPVVAATVGSGARREAQRRGLSVDSVRATPSAAGGARPLPTAVPRRLGARLSSCLHKKVRLPTWGRDRRRRAASGSPTWAPDGRLRRVAAPVACVGGGGSDAPVGDAHVGGLFGFGGSLRRSASVGRRPPRADSRRRSPAHAAGRRQAPVAEMALPLGGPPTTACTRGRAGRGRAARP
jgi:hypothetical protein